MRDRIEELIWERQDGEISGPDRVRLEELLERDPASRAQVEAAERMAARLEEAGREEPVPLELRPRIHAALAGVRRATPAGGPFAALRALFAPLAPLRPAYLVAGLVGLLLGAGGFYLLHSVGRLGPVPEQELYGTMRPHAGAGVVLEIPGGAGTLTLRREGSRLEIEAGLVAGQAGSADEIRLRGEGLAARLYEPEPASATRLEVGPREVVLARLDGGRHRLTVEVEDAGSPLELLVSARARPILQREFRLNDL